MLERYDSGAFLDLKFLHGLARKNDRNFKSTALRSEFNRADAEPPALLRACVVGRRSAELPVDVGGNAVALSFHRFHRQPLCLALLRCGRIGGHALPITVGGLLILVAGSDLIRNCAPRERNCESDYCYDAHANLLGKPSFLTEKARQVEPYKVAPIAAEARSAA
jgi:hypothetical protein